MYAKEGAGKASARFEQDQGHSKTHLHHVSLQLWHGVALHDPNHLEVAWQPRLGSRRGESILRLMRYAHVRGERAEFASKRLWGMPLEASRKRLCLSDGRRWAGICRRWYPLLAAAICHTQQLHELLMKCIQGAHQHSCGTWWRPPTSLRGPPQT